MAYILVANDDDILAEMMRHRLTKVGHEVVTVEDGEQLLDRMRYRRPDAILLDAMMPVKSGMETLFALKAGAADYVTKPFSPEDLALRIEGLLARNRFVSEGSGQRHSLH